MKEHTLISILIGLLSIGAVACGDPAADPAEQDPAFDQELGQDDGDIVDDEIVDEEVVDDQDDEVDEDDENELEGPFCGDGFIDANEACDDGNTDDGDGCSSVCEEESFFGTTEGNIQIHLVVNDLNSNEAPAQADCADVIALEVSEGVLTGEGTCALPANFLSYSLDAEVDETGLVSGEIEIVLNNRPNVVVVSGTLVDGALALGFDGVTILVGSIRGVWNGTVQADFD